MINVAKATFVILFYQSAKADCNKKVTMSRLNHSTQFADYCSWL